ncbi:MAG: endonuclease/exonuclease/phosphatase family protein [Cyclobacteriaceae bacterium]
MTVTAQKPKYGLLKRIFKVLLMALATTCSLLTLGGFWGASSYFLNLMSHFRVQYAVTLFICTLLLWLLGKRKAALLALCFALVNMAEIVPLYQKPVLKQAAGDKNTFSILQMNIFSENLQHNEVIREIERFDPDVIVMEEVNLRWYKALRQVKQAYPYLEEAVRKDNIGVMVMSRIPLENTQIIDFNDARMPSMVTRLQVNGQQVTLIATHPLSPRSRTNFHLRNNQLYAIAEAFKEYSDPLIMVGDLNITSFSPVFDRFLKTIGLYDSRKGFGVQPTWPAPFARVGIAIDHVLLSRKIRVLERQTGSRIGSDHLPVFIRLSI